MRKLLLSFGLMLALLSPLLPANSSTEIDAETARLNAWFDARFEEELSFSPMWQTWLGRKTDYGLIDDLSVSAQNERLARARKTVADLQTEFDYEKLNSEAQLSWDFWVYRLEEAIAAEQFRHNDYIFTQMDTWQASLPQFLILVHQVSTGQDMTDYIARIRGSARALDQLIVQSKENAALGVRPPRFAFESVILEAQQLISGAPFDTSDTDNAIWLDAKTKIATLLEQGSIREDEGAVYAAAAKTALLDSWRPAYQRLIDWQQEDIANTTAVAHGVSSLPDGKAYYEERLANNTTTALTAAEIHAIGLTEVARIRAEMESIKTATGFEGDLSVFFELLRNSVDDQRFFYPNTDAGRQAYLDDATATIENIKVSLPAYFGILPKADLLVQRVPAFREKDGAAQHYRPGTPDGSRPGIYFAHLSDMRSMPKYEMEVIAYHEGIPGHHMQISIAQELTDIPLFRANIGMNVFSEGWGLYAEQMAAEMPGTYQDNYSRFGRLVSEMMRAIRLVVDTGLHAEGWTEQQAIDYFAANSSYPIETITSEIQRYLVLPGQATSYKIGMLEILRLRELAQAELSDDFSVRQFHDTVLGGGDLPLVLLERRVNTWIESKKAHR